MSSQNEERQNLVSGVRIVTLSGLIFQGQLVSPVSCFSPFPKTNNSFLFIRLTCPPEILFNGTREDIQPPLYDEGDLLKINLSQIVAIGPSGDCLTDD